MILPASDQPILDFILARRSVSAALLGDPGPSREQLASLLTAAMRVPDHGKLAPWRFIALDRQARDILGPDILAIRRAQANEISEEIIQKESHPFAAPPLCLVLVSTAGEHPKIPLLEQELSAGASAMSLMMAAHAMGFAAQWLTGWKAYSEPVKDLIGVAEGEKIVGFFYIGTALAAPTERHRPSIEDHLTYWAGTKD